MFSRSGASAANGCTCEEHRWLSRGDWLSRREPEPCQRRVNASAALPTAPALAAPLRLWCRARSREEGRVTDGVTNADDRNTRITREFREHSGKVGGPFETATIIL